jgi:hypothetical protein
MSQDKIGFVTGSVRGRQKLKLNVRRFLRTLPAHKRLTKYDKLYRKKGFQKKAEDSE